MTRLQCARLQCVIKSCQRRFRARYRPAIVSKMRQTKAVNNSDYQDIDDRAANNASRSPAYGPGTDGQLHCEKSLRAGASVFVGVGEGRRLYRKRGLWQATGTT